MFSRKKFPYTFPAFVLPLGMPFYFTIVVLFLLLAFYLRHRSQQRKPLVQVQQKFKIIFEKLLHKNIEIKGIFESLYHKDYSKWEIRSFIHEVKHNSLILKTNLTKKMPDDDDDHEYVYFTPTLIQQAFFGNFSYNSGASFTLYTFKSKCIKYFEQEGIIYLEISYPTSYETGQRRAFPRVSIHKEKLQTFSVWGSETVRHCPSLVKNLETPLYIYKHEDFPMCSILNLSANGIALLLNENALEEKNIQEIQKGTCLLLLSLVQQFTDDVLNLWLMIEPKHKTNLDSNIVLGCEIKAYAKHPVDRTNLKWEYLDKNAEVPALLTWVVDDLAFGNHEKALRGLTREISFSNIK